MNPKKKRLLIVSGIIGGLFILIIVAGIRKSGEQTEAFAKVKDTVSTEFRVALDSNDLDTCEVIKRKYGLADDQDLKNLLDEYKEKIRSKKEAEKLARKQEKERANYYQVNVPFKGKRLEVTVTKIQILKEVGSFLINEKIQDGAVYFASEYTYKNVGSSATREKPELMVISPEGIEYTEDISAGVAYAGAIDDYDEELLSELQVGLRSKGVAVFKCPDSFGKVDGWKLQVSVRGSTRTLGVSVK